MSKILGRTVILTDEGGESHMYLAGEPVPADVAKQITNPAAWESDDVNVIVDIDVNEATSADVVEWVGGDVARAKAVLDAERAREKGPRSSLVKQLEEIAGLAG